MDKIVLVDVGGLGGIKSEWQPHRDKLMPIVFEPNPNHASGLRPDIEENLGGRVVQKALGSTAGHHILNITKAAGCSSLLIPCSETLQQFSVAVAFDVIDRAIIECDRYDVLMTSEDLPPPDIIKIDVQGYELEVLKGFGDSLHNCVAIEMEAHLYKIYEGQNLLGDYVSFLSEYDLMLRKMTPIDHFDGFAVEYDVWFTASPKKISKLSEHSLASLMIAEQVWKLPPRRQIFDRATFAG